MVVHQVQERFCFAIHQWIQGWLHKASPDAQSGTVGSLEVGGYDQCLICSLALLSLNSDLFLY